MEINEKPTPCDKVMLPVYFTNRTSNGLRTRKDFFDEHKVIVLRWYNNAGTMVHTVVQYPGRFLDGENFWIPEQQCWKY